MKYRRLKKTAAFFMAAALLSGSCPFGLAETAGIVMEVQAADHGVTVFQGTEKDYEYWVYEDGSVEIGTYNGSDTELVIPARVGGKQVTGVSLNFTPEKEQITKVIIPEGVKEIGGGCFMGFSKLTSISLPSTLMEIGDWAFEDCISLSTIRIPDSVAKIGEEAFDGCNSLDTINIPAAMTEIASGQFCLAPFKSIVIPGTVTRLGENAFGGCKELKNVVISNGVTEIGDNAFSGNGFTSLIIPGSVKKIGKGAFYSCEALTSLTLQNGVGTIGENAFDSCSGLTNVTIPGSVGSIGDYAFLYCKGLTNVVIQEGVTTMGEYVFGSCDNLSSITVPNSLTSIGSAAFGDYKINILGSEKSYAYQYAVKEGYIDTRTQTPNSTPSDSAAADPFPAGSTCVMSKGIYVSLGNGKAAYKAPVNKRAASAVVLNSLIVGGKSYNVTQINTKAFSGCFKLKKITVKAKSLKKVGKKAFKGIHKKAVIKVPKAKLKAYKKLFKGKGQAKSVKIRK